MRLQAKPGQVWFNISMFTYDTAKQGQPASFKLCYHLVFFKKVGLICTAFQKILRYFIPDITVIYLESAMFTFCVKEVTTDCCIVKNLFSEA